MKKLSIAYFGTPYFSANLLERILLDRTLPINVKFVITQPDKPVGRKQIIAPSPVKEIAVKNNIPVIEDLKKLQNTNILQECDFAFLYAYGGIIPKDVLTMPRLGFFNTHPSLLPQYRGPSPITYPLILGDETTGVSLIQLDEEIDHGPIISQETLVITPIDRRPDLELKLTDLAFTIFKKMITQLTSSRVHELKTSEQNHNQAVFTRILTKDDGFIPFSTLQKALRNEPFTQNDLPKLIENCKLLALRNVGKIENSSKIIFDYFRGLYPWPGIWTFITINNQKWRLKITDVELKNNQLILKKIQLEGKKEVDFITFNRAYNIFE